MEDLNFKTFTKQALRTESNVDNLNFNKHNFNLLLQLFMEVTKLLDYTKKGMFYNNYSKFHDNYESVVQNILNIAKKLNTNTKIEMSEASEDFNIRLIHGLLGYMTESGEIAQHLSNHINTLAIDKAGIGEEFADGDWYKAVTFDELDLKEDVTRENVINKLKVRFPDKYSDTHADNRDLDAERIQLEKNIK